VSSFSEKMPPALRGPVGRIVLVALTGLVVALVWGVSRWASEPVYVSLFKDLEFKEAGEVDEALTRAAVPHKLAMGGTEVQVPVSDVARARVALAKDGQMIGGRPGMELFDKPSWGMTDFAQRVTFQRALEGELARTIGGLRGVDRVQVHLALPAPTPFRQDERVASASVVLGVPAGVVLPQETILGILHIVSSSVENLSAENVAVMDDAGRVLSTPSQGDLAGGLSLRQLDVQRALETNLAAKVKNLLEPVLGAGRVRAEVTAEMSFDKVDRAVETLTPLGADWGDDDATGDDFGTTGTDAADLPAAEPAGRNGRAIERHEGAVGKLVRLSAAVLVDEGALGAAAADTTLRAARLAELDAMVRRALGASARRGDEVSLVAVPFQPAALPDSMAATPPASGPGVAALIEPFLRPAIGLLAIVVLLILAVRVLRLPLPVPASAAPAFAGADAGASGGSAGAARTHNHGAGATNGNGAGGPDDPDGRIRVVRGWLKTSAGGR
jgi:flagellar M-ring protein FliF